MFQNLITKIKNESLDVAQKLNKDSLFSALISKTVNEDNGADPNLDIPNLPEDIDFLKWQIPTSKNYEWLGSRLMLQEVDFKQMAPAESFQDMSILLKNVLGYDEGFYSTKSSPNLSLVNIETNSITDQAWENVLKLKMSDFIDWDMRKK